MDPSIRGGVPSLEAFHRNAKTLNNLGKLDGRCFSRPPGRYPGVEPDVDDASQERPRREHHGPRRVSAAVLSLDATYRAALDRESGHGSLRELEIRPPVQQAPHRPAVEPPIALRARRPDRRTLRPIQHSELDAREIRRPAHDPAERIHFAHDGALGDSADRGIAGHLTDGLQVLREQQRPRAGARRQRGRLGARVPTPDHDDVITVRHACNVGRPGAARNAGRFWRVWRHAILIDRSLCPGTPSAWESPPEFADDGDLARCRPWLPGRRHHHHRRIGRLDLARVAGPVQHNNKRRRPLAGGASLWHGTDQDSRSTNLVIRATSGRGTTRCGRSVRMPNLTLRRK